MEIKEENVVAALKEAKSDEVKNVLKALLGKTEKKPNLDDYTSIRTYEDACEVLEERPIHEDTMKQIGMPDHTIALMKLETISRALWGKDFVPMPDVVGSGDYYYPQFEIYSEGEYQNWGGVGSILHVNIGDRMRGAWFGLRCTNDCQSDSFACFGFPLCQETEEKAQYFGYQFIELWAGYLAFNFTVGWRL